ncbi:MAG: DUF5317 domain-containing protein, partial [Egibacteraceae bacterium]
VLLLAASRGVGSAVALPLLGASQLALLGFLWANRFLPGMPLIFAGFALNAAVILANGGMPVDRDALEAVVSGAAAFEPGKHRLLAPGDPLPWLADVIPLRPLRTVVSAGDVVLAAGVAVLVANLMLLDPRASGRRSRRSSAAEPVDGLDEPLS